MRETAVGPTWAVKHAHIFARMSRTVVCVQKYASCVICDDVSRASSTLAIGHSLVANDALRNNFCNDISAARVRRQCLKLGICAIFCRHKERAEEKRRKSNAGFENEHVGRNHEHAGGKVSRRFRLVSTRRTRATFKSA